MLDSENDLLGASTLVDPYPYFAKMRESAPVHWNPNYRAWFIYRYEDVVSALRNPAFSADKVRPVEAKLEGQDKSERQPTFDILEHWMVFNDPPSHTRLRKLVQPAFSPRAVEKMRPRVEQVVNETLATLEGRAEFDFVRDFAFPIPAVVIAELMAVPAEDRDQFKQWSDEILTLVFAAAGTTDRRERAQDALVALADYVRVIVDRVRVAPDDSLVSRIVHSHEVEPPLTDDEVVSTCVLLIFGGHETTTNLIANGTRALLRNPDQWERIKSDPGLVISAVEELLRYDGPARMVARRLVSDVELHGQTMKAGQIVYLVQSSANHDDEIFDRPDVMDIERKPNKHMGFGFGLHHCLGNFLARLEAQVVLEAIAKALPDLEAVEGGEHWHPTLVSRGMTEFRVRTAGVRL